ncbi:valine--tRNA ligase [Candidatus Gracilibacteria bacterium 28_42_T64]|nr:valine--tRNA ligase [Candidatus Gracilibacteria bacterium 28_42_T64]
MSEFPKKYSPSSFEESLYQKWEQEGKFKPRKSLTGEQFYIPIPPPNVTGVLHLGHALTCTLEDIMTRYHRMKGDATLWVPGTDHAGIATQAKVEEKLAKEGKTKFDLGRKDFLKECWDWKETHANIITDQFKKMGASCDWSKERFTLDADLNKRVNKAFVDLYHKDLIYKGEYMVNYSPALNTVLSDQEVVYKEEKGKLYHITYFVAGSDNEVVVATTRPETLLGDVAVAVHPKDKRYKKLLKNGKKLILPIVNKEIPIIADEMVDMDFGTGAVKITPAHDPSDFEVGKRHDLPLDIVVLGKDGKMTNIAGIFEGQDYITARSNIVELLKAKGNLIKVEDHVSKVGYCERSGAKVETIISSQWFVKVDPLVKKVVKGYKAKEFEIIPKRFNKVFEDWIFNLRDWCISRQLWWGHQIPVWYGEDGHPFCTETEEEAYELAKSHYGKEVVLTRDTDVLDTWFSSGLWPFSVLDYNMWGEEQPDLVKEFYPAQILETGHDIIFFWVIRMLLFGYEFTGQTPFEKIYLHGMVRDKHGAKMSKSAGNGINPLDMIEKYGTDALRLALSIGNTPGNDLKFDEVNVENNMIFINKLWNASRFVSVNLDDSLKESSISDIENNLLENYESLMFHEKWILSRVRYVSDLVTKSMEENNFSEGGLELQAFTKHEFCDYYIEEFKLTKETSKFGQEVITYVINTLLKLWHPYIPFVSTEIYNKLGFEGDLIEVILGEVKLPRSEEIEKEKKLIMDIIREIRSLRADNKIMPNKTIGLQIYAKNKNADIISEVLELIGGIVKAEDISLVSVKPTDDNLVYGVIKAGVEVFIDTANALDIGKETERLKEQITDTKEYIAILDKKLLNEAFVNKAPEKLVRAEMEKKEQAKDKLSKLIDKLGKLS